MAQKNRLRFNFWLNMDNEHEESIADNIELLKNKRSFTSAIRDGLRLIVDLRNGKLDVLFELFPFVKLEVLDYMKDVNPDNKSNDDIKQQIARLEQLILSQDRLSSTPVMKPLGGLQPLSNGMGINQIGGMKSIQAPVFDDDSDDDLLVVEKDTSSNKNVALNFIHSMQALQQ